MLFSRYASIAILPLVYSSAALGCSMAGCMNSGDEMRPTFTIVVTHDDKPLAGVSFHVLAKGADQFSGLTDGKGIIHVPKLQPGLYWLNGDLLGTGVVYTCFHVGEKRKQNSFTHGAMKLQELAELLGGSSIPNRGGAARRFGT
jgi:hypothetical protein